MKNLRLRLSPDGSVLVSAPYGVSRSEIDAFVESRSGWIRQQREALPPAAALSDGGTLTLFGRRLRLCVTAGSVGCREEDGKLLLSLSDPRDEAKLEEIVLGYMAERCRAVLEEAFRHFLQLSGYSGPQPQLRLRLMKSRWGSCDRARNVITLNLLLCKLPERFSRYVAAHEIVHLFVPNHSEAFYAFGEKLYPNFRETDRELNRAKVGTLFS